MNKLMLPGIPPLSKIRPTSCLPMDIKQFFRCANVISGSNMGMYFNNIKDELCFWWDPRFRNTRWGTFSCSARPFQSFLLFMSSFRAIWPRIPVSSFSTRLATTLSWLMSPADWEINTLNKFINRISHVFIFGKGKNITNENNVKLLEEAAKHLYMMPDSA